MSYLAFTLVTIGLCVALAWWSIRKIPQQEVIDEREQFEQTNVLEPLGRPIFIGWLAAAFGVLGIITLFPLRSFGPDPDRLLFRTKWSRGVRVVRENGRPIRRDDLNVNAVVTGFPEGSIGDAASQVIVVRVYPDELPQAPSGYIAFSKICTHAGCPVALYLAQQQQLLCPCHQSLFDVLNKGRVLSGPADRPLPQLPIAFDANGVLVAQGGFPEAIGPGFWERG